MMSMQDYRLVAEVIHDTRWLHEDEASLKYLVRQFCTAFKADNIRFDIGKFAEACGVEL